ncbi:MAG: T9SS type A sorting domain-containing protein [Bacteroidetes bacterium]|nr:T9SS type A sorting domain-containing protein [Bacteroidota bacterium]
MFSDISGNIYLAGRTESLNGIALNGFQNTYGGNADCFLVKLNCSGFTSPQIIGNINPEINSQYTYSVDSNLILDYDWEITGGQILSGQGSDSIEVQWDISGPGTIELFAMYSQGCYSNSILNTLINNINPVINNKTTPFPNPFNSEVTIYPNYNYDLTLKDVFGRTLLQTNDAYTLNTETLPSGIYILEVNNSLNDNSVVFKIIKN